MNKIAFILVFFAITTGVFLGSQAVFSQIYAIPWVETGSAYSIGNNNVTFDGKINTYGYSASYYFEYGNSYSSLYQTTPTQQISGGNNNTSVSMTVYGLNSNTTYYYRLVANNNFGTNRGDILSFSTNGYNNQNYYNTYVTTNSATNIGANYATLSGYAGTNYGQGEAWFEYGTNNGNLSYSSTPISIYSNNFISNLNNLIPGTLYYYRAVLRTNSNTYYGQVLNFTTQGQSYYNGTYNYQDYSYIPYNYYTQPEIRYVYVNDDSYSNGYYQNPQVYNTLNVPSNQYTYGSISSAYGYYPAQASVIGVSGSVNWIAFGAFLLLILVILVGVALFKKSY
ncbi:MAG TPA: hypothetical protein PK367_02320 [Candidatus Paceibacterota bacterium]|nr:hypothetical protein [Candidatus Paceibacterota bacterium]